VEGSSAIVYRCGPVMRAMSPSVSRTHASPSSSSRIDAWPPSVATIVAASALTEDGHSGRVYELTGRRALSFGEAVDLIGQAIGRTIRHVDVDAEHFLQRQVAYGVSPEVARLLTGLMVAIRDGSAAALADGVERALGRRPTSFEDFVAHAAAAGRWN